MITYAWILFQAVFDEECNFIMVSSTKVLPYLCVLSLLAAQKPAEQNLLKVSKEMPEGSAGSPRPNPDVHTRTQTLRHAPGESARGLGLSNRESA